MESMSWSSFVTMMLPKKAELIEYLKARRLYVNEPTFEEIKNGRVEEIDINSGDILNILPSGEIIRDRFTYMEYIGIGRYNWWNYNIENKSNARKSYIEELKAIATYQGISPEEIDDLLSSGFALDEIEDYIYCME